MLADKLAGKAIVDATLGEQLHVTVTPAPTPSAKMRERVEAYAGTAVVEGKSPESNLGQPAEKDRMAEELKELEALGYVGGSEAGGRAGRGAGGGGGGGDSIFGDDDDDDSAAGESPARSTFGQMDAAELAARLRAHIEEAQGEDSATLAPPAERPAPAENKSAADQQPQPDVPPPDQLAPSQAAQTKIIKTGELELEVPDYEQAVEQAQGIVRQAGAFVADVWSQEQAGGAMLGRLTIRVAPERFETLFAALKAVGRVEAENVKAADVTAQYVDTDARIQSLQITEQRLRELIANKSIIDKMSAVLEVERELNRVRTEIEQLQGQLRVMASQIALSTITVTLKEPARTVPSAAMAVEVPTLEEGADALSAAVERLGGRLLSGRNYKRDDGTIAGEYKLEVTLDHFDELVAAVTALGRVDQRQISDHQFNQAAAAWAPKVRCQVGLNLWERSRQLPSGSVQLEVEAVPDALAKLEPLAAEATAAIVSNQTTRRDDGTQVAQVELKVPAGRFAGLVEALAALGRTTAKQVSGEAGRIVGGAASVPCSLTLTVAERPREIPSGQMVIEVETFESARGKLSALIRDKNVQVLGSASSQRTDGTWVGAFRLGIRAADMEAVVAGLEGLGHVSSRQLSGLGLGDLSRADPNALGVIEITIGEKAAISPGPERAGDSLRSRLRDGLAGLYASLGLIVYGLVLLAPWLIVVIVAAWLINRAWKKSRQAKPAPAKA